MSEKKKKFLKILCVELEDLIEDLDLLIQTHEQRRSRDEITEYVFRENTALLDNERRALKSFLEELCRLGPEKFNDVKELEKAIESKFADFLEEHSYAHAVESFVERKMRKALDYCQGS